MNLTQPHPSSLWCTKELLCFYGKKVDCEFTHNPTPLKAPSLWHRRVTVVISNWRISGSVAWLPGGVSPSSKLTDAIVLFFTLHTKSAANKLSFCFSSFLYLLLSSRNPRSLLKMIFPANTKLSQPFSARINVGAVLLCKPGIMLKLYILLSSFKLWQRWQRHRKQLSYSCRKILRFASRLQFLLP